MVAGLDAPDSSPQHRPLLRGMSTAVYVSDDLDAARRWYTELLGFEPYFDRPPYIEWRLGDYQHELGILDRKYSTAEPGANPRPGPAGVVLYWHVDDIQATIDRLVALGATVLDPPRQFGDGFVAASVVDPFGNILGVMYNRHYLEMLAHTAGGRLTTEDERCTSVQHADTATQTMPSSGAVSTAAAT